MWFKRHCLHLLILVMASLMVSSVPISSKWLRAVSAVERAFFGVRALVVLESGSVAETLEAHIALERFLTRCFLPRLGYFASLRKLLMLFVYFFFLMKLESSDGSWVPSTEWISSRSLEILGGHTLRLAVHLWILFSLLPLTNIYSKEEKHT